MKNGLYLLKVLWAYYYFLIFTLIFLVLYPAFLILLSKEKWFPEVNWLRVVWARILFLFTGIIYEIRYEKILDRSQTYIFCPNHFSYIDIPMSALVVKRNWRFMAKTELSTIPVLNIFFKRLDITVDRRNLRESYKANQKAGESLDEGINIVVYPEGTIGSHQPELERFKNGPFRLAIEKQVPIVPVTMADNGKILFVDGWKMYGRPGIARVFVHSPVETHGMTMADLPMLKNKVFTLIDHQLKVYEFRNRHQKLTAGHHKES
ncbi:MAG: 1-acyl-sn-glycerol-3-phosphate acyltransferase [Chitinophagales bacterium]|nr:1-acyl-sn-glycerol-3-phosphate acyltransferase [Chitinophagales bacterium]